MNVGRALASHWCWARDLPAFEDWGMINAGAERRLFGRVETPGRVVRELQACVRKWCGRLECHWRLEKLF